MSAAPPIAVHALREQHLDAVLAIAAVVPTAPHWPPGEYRRMLQVIAQRPARRGAWVAVADGVVRGFAMASHLEESAELEAVVTAPGHGRRGIGSALLAQAIAWSQAVGADRLLLEVRSSNEAALRLYARHGFSQDGVRRGYYRNPDEDAMLLSLKL